MPDRIIATLALNAPHGRRPVLALTAPEALELAAALTEAAAGRLARPLVLELAPLAALELAAPRNQIR